ncbi:uncharacterized protein VTP21DRAFT_3470 [Calcarisporiella thermophila]|uniref:uncharacterized protein n=1 Tax=Calcarisporiella thermophila TaxID=911321 RepID=UPI0037441FCD
MTHQPDSQPSLPTLSLAEEKPSETLQENKNSIPQPAHPEGSPADKEEEQENVDTREGLKSENNSSSELNKKGKPKRERGPGRKRKRNDAENEEADNEDQEGEDAEDESRKKQQRLPKRKVALLLGYCGTGYQGLQANPNAKTIEGDLFKALAAAGAVSQDNADDPKKVSLLRCARTDKGVHAAGNILSLKMIIEDSDIVAKVNECLPEQIRVWGFTRVIKSFNPKQLCDSRMYEYLLPTYILRPQSSEELARAQSIASRASQAAEVNEAFMHPKPVPEDIAEMRKYRIPAETLEKVRQGFEMYLGTHNFHNFTVGKKPEDRSCKRHMIKIEISDPMIIRDTEWLSLKIHGQSFMLHQIRKMVGLIILLIRSGSPLDLIPRTFQHDRINIPKAPGIGLLLERPVFSSFNKKCKENGREQIDFDVYKDEIEAFKQKYIYNQIIDVELETNAFAAWVQSIEVLAVQSRAALSYLNKEGVIPAEAIVKVGQKIVEPTLGGEEDGEEAAENEDC